MNMRLKAFLILFALMVIMTGAPLQAATSEESFKKSFIESSRPVSPDI